MARHNPEMEMLDAPIYTVPLAGRLVGLSTPRVRRWLKGYDFSYVDRRGAYRTGHSLPVVAGHSQEGKLYASFLHLMDLLFVREFMRRGISLQRIRGLLDEIRAITGGPHFAMRRLFTHGKRVFLGLKAELGQDAGQFLELATGGQYAVPKFVEQIGDQIKFAPSGWAEKWYPPGYYRIIVLDPEVSFGRPTIAGHRVTTSMVHEAYLAEDNDIKTVCDWMNLAPRQVKASVAFEKALAEAA